MIFDEILHTCLILRFGEGGRGFGLWTSSGFHILSLRSLLKGLVLTRSLITIAFKKEGKISFKDFVRKKIRQIKLTSTAQEKDGEQEGNPKQNPKTDSACLEEVEVSPREVAEVEVFIDLKLDEIK